MKERVRTVAEDMLLFRLPDRRLDALLTATVLGLLAWSRFALLAAGPWEWDEAIFARGILDFNLAAHFPHPPGFPGWMAIGHLLLPVAGDPLRALQWASAALSVAMVWPLAALGRRVAPPGVALAAALLVLLAPGPWLHAVRGFSSTPATALGVAAAAVAVAGLQGRRATLFTLLVTVAFLIRPILLPPLAVLWLAGAWTVRPRRRLLPGVVAACSLVVLSVWMMAVAEGGWRAFVEPFVRHGEKHFSRLVSNPDGLSQLGLLKGLGGVGWGLLVLVVAAAGLVIWARRVGRSSALAWAAVLGVLVAQLFLVQNRSYPRYAVPAQVALAPLVAAAAAVLPPLAATTALAAAAGGYAVVSYPVVAEQHRTLLPGYEAVVRAAEEGAARHAVVVVEPELYPFASYHWYDLARQGVRPPPLVLSPWAPEPWTGVQGPWLVATVHRQHYLDSLLGEEMRWGGVSPRLARLTQGRFLRAWLIAAPALPLTGWWPAEDDPGGGRFMWGGSSCDLLLPPLPPDTSVGIELRPAPGRAPLTVSINGTKVAEVGGRSSLSWRWLGADHWRHDAVNLLSLERAEGYPPGAGDRRPLGVQVRALGVRGPSLPWVVRMAGQNAAGAFGAAVEGSYPPERVADGGWGAWLAPDARLRIPAGPGRLFLEMSAPRPSPPETIIRLNGATVAGPLRLTGAPTEVVVRLRLPPSTAGVVTLEVTSVPYVPADVGSGDDRRRLGVMLHSVRFEPESPPEWARRLWGQTVGGHGEERCSPQP